MKLFCSRCFIEKDCKEFPKTTANKKGFAYWCKECSNKWKEEYRLKNPEKIKLQTKIYNLKHKEEKSIRDKNHRIKNKEILRIKSTIYIRQRRRTDVNFRLLSLLRLRLHHALVNNYKSDRTINLIGCDIEQLKNHLQQTAIQNGYLDFNINNYDSKKFNIDHITPCCCFELNCSYHQKLCFNYKNLQILTRHENCKKLKCDLSLKKYGL
jgi:hypothetical protein